MIIEAMNSKTLTAMLNKMRPSHAATVLLGTVNSKIRGMFDAGMLKATDIPARGSDINLTKDDAVTVLLTFRQYNVPEQVRVALGGETATTLATSVTTPSTAVTTTPVKANVPAELKVQETNGVQTMSSLDMVTYINSTREPHAAELRHDHFMAKVPTVIEAAPKFLGTAFYNVNGAQRTQAIYNFPKREAMLMAMSYSTKLQAKVYDSWEAAEAKLAVLAPAPVLGNIPNFDDPIEAAEAWIAQRKQQNVLKLELSTASAALTEAQPKVAFHDAVVADDSMHSLGDAIKLIAGAGMGRTAFIKWLKENKYLQPDRVPYQRHINAGILESSFRPNFVTPSGRVIPKTTYVTGKGIAYFQPKIAKFLEVTNG